MVRVPIPMPTEERRKELVKHVHKVLENHRTWQYSPRQHEEAIDKLEKSSQNKSAPGLEKVLQHQKLKIEDLSATKEKEVMEIE